MSKNAIIEETHHSLGTEKEEKLSEVMSTLRSRKTLCVVLLMGAWIVRVDITD